MVKEPTKVTISVDWTPLNPKAMFMKRSLGNATYGNLSLKLSCSMTYSHIYVQDEMTGNQWAFAFRDAVKLLSQDICGEQIEKSKATIARAALQKIADCGTGNLAQYCREVDGLAIDALSALDV